MAETGFAKFEEGRPAIQSTGHVCLVAACLVIAPHQAPARCRRVCMDVDDKALIACLDPPYCTGARAI